MRLIRKKAFARAGLVGNPSDGYFGKAISLTLKNFSARITLQETPDLRILAPPEEAEVYPSIHDLMERIELLGYYGGDRLIKAAIKKFIQYARNHGVTLHDRNFTIRYQNLQQDLHGKTLGLLGFGRIGSEVGHVCRQIFSIRVIACDPYLSDSLKESYEDQVAFVELHELFSKADIISVHVPLAHETRYMVGNSELALMGPDAILINTSRGDVVDETELFKAMKEKQIGGAGLDVFSKEPVPKDNPLLQLENVILTPHSAALTRECVIRMATEAARCVLDVFSSREPPNIANRQVLTSKKWRHLSHT